MNWKAIAIVIGIIGGLPAAGVGISWLLVSAEDINDLKKIIGIYQNPQTMPAWAFLMKTYREDRLSKIEQRLINLEK